MSNRIQKFSNSSKKFLTTHPWAAGLWTLDAGPATTSCGRTTEGTMTGRGVPEWKSKKKRRKFPGTSHEPNAVLVLDLPALRLLWLQFMRQADGATAEWNGPKTENEVEAGIRPRPRETVPKMFCNMRRVGKFIINSMRQHGSQTFHMLFKMPHCPMSQAGICPSVHPSLPSVHPFHPIPSKQSSQQLLAIFIYTYSVRTSTLARLLLQHLDMPKCVKCIFAEFKFHNRMTTIGNSWTSKFYI